MDTPFLSLSSPHPSRYGKQRTRWVFLLLSVVIPVLFGCAKSDQPKLTSSPHTPKDEGGASARVGGSAFVVTQGGRAIPLGGIEVGFFDGEQLRQFIAARQVQIDNEALRCGGALLSAGKRVAALESLLGSEKAMRALLNDEHFDQSKGVTLVAALDEQRNILLKAIQDTDSGLARSDLQLLNAALRDDFAYRIDVQGSQIGLLWPTADDRTRRELTSTLRALKDFQPEFESALQRNLDTYFGLLKDTGSLASASSLSGEIKTANAALNQANRTANEFTAIASRGCFEGLPQPVRSTLTEMDGHFQVELPLTKKIAVVARGKRTLPDRSVEEYFWFRWLEPEQKNGAPLTLTNANMTDSPSALQIFRIPVLPALPHKMP